MRLVFVLSLLILLGMSASAILADPNSHEAKPWHVYLGGARTTYSECTPDPSCNDTCPQAQQMACGDVIAPASLVTSDQDWYSWTMNAGDQLTCGTDVFNNGDNTDTYIELYANDCSTLLTQDDDSGPGFYSMISGYTAPYTGVYSLKVRGYNSSSTGPYKFYVTCGTQPPPENDLCSGAIQIPDCSAGSLSGDTSLAHNDYDPGSGGCTGYPEAGLDVVYYVNLNAGDIVDMSYLQQNQDTAFYVVTDCSNVAGTCVAGADQTVPPDPEVIHYVAAASGTYYIILDSYGTDTGGPWTLDYNFTCPPPPVAQACCFQDGHCEMQLPNDCRQMGGTPQGDGTDCNGVTCHVNATHPSTWGHIKGSYR